MNLPRPPIAQMPDRTLLELVNSPMPPDQTARLSVLSAKQKAGKLVADEPKELGELLQIYNERWLYKTDALVEAIKRGLVEPID